MVPLFLNNACPEGSLAILYHKSARRYKMGDEIHTAVYSRFAMFRRILGVPQEGRQPKHSTPRPVQSKPGTLSGTRPSAITEFSL